jgi:hypothetical protein
MTNEAKLADQMLSTPSADERWLHCTIEFLHMQEAFGIHEIGYETEFFHPRWKEFLSPQTQRAAILAWQRRGL